MLAYKGLDLGNLAINTKVVAWAEKVLKGVEFDTPGNARRQWAEAMVERYGGVPIEPEWANDPLVSRMNPQTAESLHQEMLRQFTVAWEKSPRRLLAMSDADQVGFASSQLARGLPVDQRDAFIVLAHRHSSLILPVIEIKMEEIVKSPNPLECFSDKSVNPEAVFSLAAMILTQAGDFEALRQASRFMKVKKVVGLVRAILVSAAGRGNAFTVIYNGMEIGDPEVERQMVAWAEETLAEPSLNIPRDARRQWAEVLANRNGGSPTAEQWSGDALVSRLKPSIAESLHDDIVRLAAEGQREQANK